MDAFQTNHAIDICGHKLAYYRRGRGPSILFVHGITTYSFIWRNLVSLMHDDFDVIAIDLIGCGDSDKPLDVSYSLNQHAETIYHLVDTLGIKKFHFVSHDVGGGIGQIFAVRYPDRLLSLTMLNSVGYDFWPVQPIIAMRTPIIRQMAMATLDIGVFKMIVKRGVFHKNRVTDELMNYFWKPMKTKQGRKAFLHFAKCLNNKNLVDIAEDLRRLTVPVLIIRGENDVYLNASICKKLSDEIPNSQMVNIPTGGHFIQEDEPEQLVSQIRKFFDEISNEH